MKKEKCENSGPELKGLQENSLEVQEILGKPPHWIGQWGMPLIMTLTASVVLAGALIRFPQVEERDLTVTYPYGPEPVCVPFSGRITALHRQNGQYVETGDTIAFMEDGMQGTWIASSCSGIIEAHRRLVCGATLSVGDTLCWIVPEDMGEPTYHGYIEAWERPLFSVGSSVDVVMGASTPEGMTRTKGVISFLAGIPEKDGTFYYEVELSDKSVKPTAYQHPRCLIQKGKPTLLEKLFHKAGGFKANLSAPPSS